MGCFFGCFRTKSSKASFVSPTEPVATRSKNALSSLFVTDDESLRKGEECQNQLEDKAKFLKASATLPETSVKIQKDFKKWEGISGPNEAGKSIEFNKWLQSESIEKLKSKKQFNESPVPVPVKITEEWMTGSPSSCMTDGHNTQSASSSSIQRKDVQNVDAFMAMCDSETHSAISSVSSIRQVKCEKKYDCSKYTPDSSALSSEGSSSPSDCVSPQSKQLGSTGMGSVTKSLSYPISVKLTEMQTTGDVFPGYRNSVLDPAENPSQRNELKDECSDSNLPSESDKLSDELTSIPNPVSDLSVQEETKIDTGLSSWFKPISAKQDDNSKRFSSSSSENVHRRKVPVDRPILGMVAAHWNDNDEEVSHILPKSKWWDGNGIPNSTNKYKEDQKVSWHATPFEERLEKALSEETVQSQKKPINRTPPFELSETEESDTALSHMRSSSHLKSVVSF